MFITPRQLQLQPSQSFSHCLSLSALKACHKSPCVCSCTYLSHPQHCHACHFCLQCQWQVSGTLASTILKPSCSCWSGWWLLAGVPSQIQKKIIFFLAALQPTTQMMEEKGGPWQGRGAFTPCKALMGHKGCINISLFF